MSDTFTGETYNTLCIDAEKYLAKDSPEQARELLQKAISLIATRPRARSILADTCMSMELWSEARSQLEVLLTLDEGNIGNNFKLAQVLEELGEYQLAMDNYTVVLDDEPDHHGALVAIKRIESRTKDSWVNLTDIFNNSPDKDPVKPIPADDADEFKDGMQVFPDVPSDGLFADSENDEEASVERLLKNIGLSGDSAEEDDDSSELLENIGVSTTQTLQSAFTDSEDSQDESADKKAAEAAQKQAVRSLDEIFGTSVAEEVTELEPEAEEPEELEPEVLEPEAEEPEELEEETESEPEEPEEETAEQAEEVEAEAFSFSSGKTLEAIFNAPETEEAEPEAEEPEAEEPAEEETEPEAEEPEAEEPAEEETEPEAEEPEAEEPAEEEAEPEAEEPAEEEAEPEAEEPEVEEPAEEEAEPEAEEPEAEEPAEEEPEEKEIIAAVLKQDADLSIDSWSRESGLLTVHLKSGTAHVKSSILTIYEKSMKVELSGDDTVDLSGVGTFLLNCGYAEPLIVELKENMVIRKDAVAFHTGTIGIELLDLPDNDSLYVIKGEIREKVIFLTDHPFRVILLGGNNRVFYVRTSSIIATDPEILFSSTGSPEAYTEITGFGKVYLIE